MTQLPQDLARKVTKLEQKVLKNDAWFHAWRHRLGASRRLESLERKFKILLGLMLGLLGLVVILIRILLG